MARLLHPPSSCCSILPNSTPAVQTGSGRRRAGCRKIWLCCLAPAKRGPRPRGSSRTGVGVFLPSVNPAPRDAPYSLCCMGGVASAHEQLKRRIHAFRVPLSPTGQAAMGVLYFTVPLVAGWHIYSWQAERTEREIPANVRLVLLARSFRRSWRALCGCGLPTMSSSADQRAADPTAHPPNRATQLTAPPARAARYAYEGVVARSSRAHARAE